MLTENQNIRTKTVASRDTDTETETNRDVSLITVAVMDAPAAKNYIPITTATPDDEPLHGGQPPTTGSQSEFVSNFWNIVNVASQKVSEVVKQAEGSAAIQDAVHMGRNFASKAQMETQTMFEKVKEAFDPMQGLEGTEMKVIVTSLQPSKVMAVQSAVSTVFPVSDMSVSGVKVDSGIAAQPVGFTAGQRGAENRIVNMRLLGAADLESALIVSIENFIAEIEGNWFDLACVILRDEEHDMSLVSFSQAVRVPSHYVEEAKKATNPTYQRKDSGLEVTVGEMIHKGLPHVSADDWHGNATNGHMKRAQILEQCVVTVMGEYLVERRRARVPQTPKPNTTSDART